MLTLDPKQVGQVGMYKLLIGSIVPRPIAFISTVNPEGVGNLAPFSFFNGVSSNPPCVMVSITRKNNGDKKDTLRNIEATEEFVVNLSSEWLAQAINQCSAEYPYGVDEMQKVGLTPLASTQVRPARVQESPIQMECRLHKTLEIGDGTQGSSTIVVGEIVAFHVRKEAYRDGKILLNEIKPISRLGGISYGKTTETFDLPRPSLDATPESHGT